MDRNVLINCTRYALTNIEKINPVVLPYVKAMMSDKQASGIIKEKVIAHQLNLKHNPHKHGADASGKFKGIQRLVEEKSETTQGVATKTKMSGRTTWGTKTEENLKTIWDNDELVVVSGWTENGHLVYIVSFDFCESGLYDEIYNTLGSNTQPKGTWKHFPDSFDVLHLNTAYENLLTSPFLKAVKLNNRSS